MDVKKFLEKDNSSVEGFEQELKDKDDRYGFMRKIVSGEEEREGKLSGIPFVVKDAICAENVTTSAGSEILENYKPVFDSTVVKRLKKEGAVFFGKTNQDEFGFGTFTTKCAFGTPVNPHDPERVVGGSSGGAAAAVAALDKPLVSVGESTGGSITNPAAYNGVVGLTPTYGRVSRYGLIDYGNSLDKIGMLADSVYGVSKGLEVIAGPDEKDHTTVDKEVPNFSELEEISDLKIGVPRQYIQLEGLQEDVRRNFEKSIEWFEDNGHEVDKVDIPLLDADYSVATYYILAVSEASTNLARFSGLRYGKEENPEDFEDFNDYFASVRSRYLGEEAKRRILLGTYMRKAGYRDQYYIKAAKVRSKLIRQMKEVFEDYDVLASPSMPNIAPRIEEVEEMSPSEIYAMDSLTVGPNLAGMPMISVPNGTSQGMPTGLHLIANQFEEKKLLDTAYTYEKGVHDD